MLDNQPYLDGITFKGNREYEYIAYIFTHKWH